MAFDLTALSFQQRGKRPQLDRRIYMKPKGHIYECNFQRHGVIVAISKARAHKIKSEASGL